MSEMAQSATPRDVLALLEQITADIDCLSPAALPAVISAGAGLVARASSRLASGIPDRDRDGTSPAPALASLPLITKGPQKGERWMSKRQFAAWCGVTVATVSDWIYTQRLAVTKRGSRQQSRVLIASGERERLRPPVVNRKKGGDDA